MYRVLAVFIPRWALVYAVNLLLNVIDHCPAQKFDDVYGKMIKF